MDEYEAMGYFINQICLWTVLDPWFIQAGLDPESTSDSLEAEYIGPGLAF
jgi:hypothetical protein